MTAFHFAALADFRLRQREPRHMPIHRTMPHQREARPHSQAAAATHPLR